MYFYVTKNYKSKTGQYDVKESKKSAWYGPHYGPHSKSFSVRTIQWYTIDIWVENLDEQVDCFDLQKMTNIDLF